MDLKNFEKQKERLLIVSIILLLILLFAAIYIGSNAETRCNKIIANNYEQITRDPCIKQCLGIIEYKNIGGETKWNTQQK